MRTRPIRVLEKNGFTVERDDRGFANGRGEEVDARADLYSLGITGHELLTGAPPFRGRVMQVVLQHLGSEPPSFAECEVDVPGPLP